MWLTVILSIVLLNLSLLVIHHVGSKAIMLTWIPARSIVLVISMLRKKELIGWLKVTWASSAVAVSFLVVFHFTLRLLKKGRMPRFSCAHKEWILCWIIAIAVTSGATIAVRYTDNDYIYFAIGILAAYMNVINVTDAPGQLQQNHIKFTTYYVIFINLLAVGALVTIDQLIQRGEVEWAGICSNFPILAAMLLAGSTCTSTTESMRTTTQHVYMLAYQTWPSMVFVGVLWGAEPLGQTTSLILGSTALIIVLLVQYSMVKTELS
jgi:hypothetical protein